MREKRKTEEETGKIVRKKRKTEKETGRKDSATNRERKRERRLFHVEH